MKRSYIEQKAFLEAAGELVRASSDCGREVFSTGATALLVVDMQDYFIDPRSHAYIPGAGDLIPGISSLARAFVERDLPVIFTRHLNTDDDSAALGLWWNDLIRADSPMSEITSGLDTSLGVVMEKSQYDAFHDTDLEARLTQAGVTRAVITGVATHLCCETTARAAFVRGFEVTIPVDGTATYDSRHHLASLINLAHGFASMVTVEGLLEAMGEA